MRERCYLPTHISYPHHGALGVTVCNRWLGKDGFKNFLADMGPRPAYKTLDRKNPFGNYEPGNCQWADRVTQANNKRANYIPILADTPPMDELAELEAGL